MEQRPDASDKPASSGAAENGASRLPMVTPAPPASTAGDTPATAPAAAVSGGGAPADTDLLMGQVVETLRTVYDPEIPVNIYELGMIYNVAIEPPGNVNVRMTLTSPSCPVAGSLPGDVQLRVQNIPGVTSAKVDLVWEPPWNPSMMTDAAKLELGML